MKRLRNLLLQAEFHILLFFLGFALLNWPFLGVFRSAPPQVFLIYIYVLWALAIVLLFLVSSIGKESVPWNHNHKRKDPRA